MGCCSRSIAEFVGVAKPDRYGPAEPGCVTTQMRKTVMVARITATIATGIISHKTRRFAALTFPSSTSPSLTRERDDLLDLPDVIANARGHGGRTRVVGGRLMCGLPKLYYMMWRDTAAASAAARD